MMRGKKWHEFVERGMTSLGGVVSTMIRQWLLPLSAPDVWSDIGKERIKPKKSICLEKRSAPMTCSVDAGLQALPRVRLHFSESS